MYTFIQSYLSLSIKTSLYCENNFLLKQIYLRKIIHMLVITRLACYFNLHCLIGTVLIGVIMCLYPVYIYFLLSFKSVI